MAPNLIRMKLAGTTTAIPVGLYDTSTDGVSCIENATRLKPEPPPIYHVTCPCGVRSIGSLYSAEHAGRVSGFIGGKCRKCAKAEKR